RYQIGAVNVVNVGECSAPYLRARSDPVGRESPMGRRHSPTFTGGGSPYLVRPVNVAADTHRRGGPGGPRPPIGRPLPPLPRPPKSNGPGWLTGAWKTPPRDAGGLALFPAEYAAAERFWAWLGDCYAETAGRCRSGYAYLTSAARPADEAFALYEALLRWL